MQITIWEWDNMWQQSVPLLALTQAKWEAEVVRIVHKDMDISGAVIYVDLWLEMHM